MSTGITLLVLLVVGLFMIVCILVLWVVAVGICDLMVATLYLANFALCGLLCVVVWWLGWLLLVGFGGFGLGGFVVCYGMV